MGILAQDLSESLVEDGARVGWEGEAPLVDGSLLMFFKKHFVKHQVDGTLGVGAFLYSGFILSLH